MKTISSDFLTMLQTSASLVEADLYTITLASGVVLYYTSAQQNIVYNGNTYLSALLDNNPSFKRGATRTAVGLQSDDLEIDILYDGSSRILSATPAAFAAAGGFDNATVKLDKALAPDWSNPVVHGVVNLFTGLVAEVECDAATVKMTVNSQLRRLTTSFPRNYCLPNCNHALFDSGCGLLAANFAINGTVAGGSSLVAFTSNCAQADGWFALGYIKWTSGANTGQTSLVKSYVNASGAFTILYPLASQPQAGDTFTAYPGCDKTQSTCQNKFGNLGKFRGYPFVPTPEVLELGSQGAPPAQYGGQGGSGISRMPRGPGGQFNKFAQE